MYFVVCEPSEKYLLMVMIWSWKIYQQKVQNKKFLLQRKIRIIPFNVRDIVLTDSSGKSVSPRWDTTAQERCDDGAKIIESMHVIYLDQMTMNKMNMNKLLKLVFFIFVFLFCFFYCENCVEVQLEILFPIVSLFFECFLWCFPCFVCIASFLQCFGFAELRSDEKIQNERYSCKCSHFRTIYPNVKGYEKVDSADSKQENGKIDPFSRTRNVATVSQ